MRVFPKMRAPGWTLTSTAFERLLDALDPDRERAAALYQHLHARTAGLLSWWGASNAHDLADTTLDRVARKLEEGATIPHGALGAFVRGVARMVFYESTREHHTPIDEQTAAAVSAPAPTAEESRTLGCFDRCLAALAAGDRNLVLGYYGDGKARQVREHLARDLGISPTALRIRVHRLRRGLEQCVAACVGT